MADQFLKLVNGIRTAKTPVVVSAGALDAEKIVALGDFGRLDDTVMPRAMVDVSAGAGDQGKMVLLNVSGRIDSSMVSVSGDSSSSETADETIAAGALVAFAMTANGVRIVNADNTSSKIPAGFVLTGPTSAGSTVTMFFEGEVTGLSGLTNGAPVYLSSAGAVTSDEPVSTGHIKQVVGKATSASSFIFHPMPAVIIA